MKRLSILLLIATTVCILNSCKKNNKNEPNKNDPVVDNPGNQNVLESGTLTGDALEATANQIIQNDDAKHIIFPDGQDLYSFLVANAPELLSAPQAKKVNSVSSSHLNDEQEIKLLQGLMQGRALQLAHYVNFNSKINQDGKQPNGLAYVYGGRNPDVPTVGSSHNKIAASCQDPLYGLDCSGYVDQMMLKAGITFSNISINNMGTSELKNLNYWNDAFTTLGYPNIRMKDYLPNTLTKSDVKFGDIIYWVDASGSIFHIGIALTNQQGNLEIFVSNGGSENSCAKNMIPTRGPHEFLFDDQIRNMYYKDKSGNKIYYSWGILRMTTQQMVYSGTTGLPDAPKVGSINIPHINGLKTNADDINYDYRYLAATGLGDKLFFGIGNRIMIYDTTKKAWTFEPLRANRTRWAAAAIGTKVIFAGGMSEESASGYTDAVDIYDLSNSTWTHDQRLSQARSHLAAAAAGTKIVFAGGDSGNAYVSTVDIYDVSKSKWDPPTHLKAARRKFSGAATGNIMMFAGGEDGSANVATNLVDVYNTTSNSWSVTSLFTSDYGFGGTGAGNKIIFDGGSSTGPIIFDITETGYPPKTLTVPHPYGVSASAGNFILFGGAGTVDAYNVLSGQWQSIKVDSNLQYSLAASTGKTIMLAGHPLSDPNNIDVITTIDIFNLVEK